MCRPGTSRTHTGCLTFVHATHMQFCRQAPHTNRVLFSGKSDDTVDGEDGHCSRTVAEVARWYAWSTVFNGDVRCDKEVQHYCGPHCCRDIQETRRKLKWAVDVLLRPLPQIFPRKSWAGQAKAASHVLLLMVLHDVLAENWSSVQARRVELTSFVGEIPSMPGHHTFGQGGRHRIDRSLNKYDRFLANCFFAAFAPGTVAFTRRPTPV